LGGGTPPRKGGPKVSTSKICMEKGRTRVVGLGWWSGKNWGKGGGTVLFGYGTGPCWKWPLTATAELKV